MSRQSTGTIRKSKKYVKSGQKPPEGVKLNKGPRGGIYYNTEDLQAVRGSEPKKRLPAFRKQEDGSLKHNTKTGAHGPGSYHIHERFGKHYLVFVPKEGKAQFLESDTDPRSLKQLVGTFKDNAVSWIKDKISPKSPPEEKHNQPKPQLQLRKEPGNHPVFPVPLESYRHIESAGKRIRGQLFESAICLNPDGKQIFFQDGERKKVTIKLSEYSKFRGLRLVHNHPSIPSPSFSFADLRFAFKSHVAESWVFGRDGSKYLILPPEGEKFFGEKTSSDEVIKKITEIRNQVKMQAAINVRNGKISPEMELESVTATLPHVLHAKGILRVYVDKSNVKRDNNE
jgi:hypothetical protein